MNDVRRQLIVYERNGRILKWHDRKIPPGADWRSTIDDRIEQASVILLFFSPYFIESRYCYEVEGQVALRRATNRSALVIPVILCPCAWQESPFGKLQALPLGGRPITQWPDRDQVCLDVARAVVDAATNGQLASAADEAPSSQPSSITAIGANGVITSAQSGGVAVRNVVIEVGVVALTLLGVVLFIWLSRPNLVGTWVAGDGGVFEVVKRSDALWIESKSPGWPFAATKGTLTYDWRLTWSFGFEPPGYNWSCSLQVARSGESMEGHCEAGSALPTLVRLKRQHAMR